VLACEPAIRKLAERYAGFENFLYIGRKYHYPTALEGALKLKEISYIHAEGYPAGEMKHGPIALISSRFPTMAIAPSDAMYEKMLSNMQEIKARGGPLAALATEGNQDIHAITEDVVYLPAVPEMLMPIVAIVPLQLFAYHVAVLRGCDVDKPRNLAKSVTVE
jgi:glucosamine--fructose-6-phosphate aminotransferase (isomerizing)